METLERMNVHLERIRSRKRCRGSTKPLSTCWLTVILVSFARGFVLRPLHTFSTSPFLGIVSRDGSCQQRRRNAAARRWATTVPNELPADDSNSMSEKLREITQRTRISDNQASLPAEGLSKFHRSILSHSSDRQRFVTGRYPLRVTVQETPTRRWLGIGRDSSTGTAQIFINGTTVDRSLASFDRFQWLDEHEREDLVDRFSLVSLELVAEVHMKRPGYVNVLPAHGAGSSAALQKVASEHSWNRWKRKTAMYEQIESTRWQAPYRDRIWVTGFSLASSRGHLQSIDAETARIESVSDRTGSFIRWPNESNSVPLQCYTNKGADDGKSNELDDALLISDGFLVPGKDKGGLYIVKSPGNEKAEWSVCLTGSKSDSEAWFYHRSVWVDLTGDGRKSILTARAKPPPLLRSGGRRSSSPSNRNTETGQLVWLEMPKPHSVDQTTGTPLEKDGTVFDPFSSRHIPWKVHLLDEGPDVMFTMADLDTSDDTIEVISSQFFEKKVTLHSIQRGPEPKVTFRRTLDDKCGAAYGSILADLDRGTDWPDPSRSERIVIDSGSTVQTQKPGDSFSHLLVTSHECSFDDETDHLTTPLDTENEREQIPLDGGSLFAYRVPSGKGAWKTESWIRTTVASGFRVKGTIGNIINPGAPGFVYTFYPTKDGASTGQRPLIAIAGDCAESAYIYRPSYKGEGRPASHADPSARYKLMCEIECGATVGSIGIGYDNFYSAEQKAGYAKLYIPCYEKDRMYVFAMGNGEDDFVEVAEEHVLRAGVDDGW